MTFDAMLEGPSKDKINSICSQGIYLIYLFI
jgi:hypothetical protein